MKNLKKYFALLAIAACTFNACDEEPPTDDGPGLDGEMFEMAIADSRAAATQSFTISMPTVAGAEETITGNQGSKFSFYANSLSDADGNPVTGTVNIELIEVFEKSDMLLLNKTTMGILPSGDHAMLVSGGEFQINAKQGGEYLYITGYVGIEIPAANTGGFDNDMVLFQEACCANDCDGVIVCENEAWVELEDSTGQGGVSQNSIGNYVAGLDSFGWTNIDRFYSDPAPKTELLVQAPAEYDQSTLGVYLSVDGEGHLLAGLDKFIEADGLFSEHYGQMPIGLDVHIIALAMKSDGQRYYTIKAATIADGDIIVLDDLEPISEAALVTEINSLP